MRAVTAQLRKQPHNLIFVIYSAIFILAQAEKFVNGDEPFTILSTREKISLLALLEKAAGFRMAKSNRQYITTAYGHRIPKTFCLW
jgi:hypothetical protein